MMLLLSKGLGLITGAAAPYLMVSFLLLWGHQAWQGRDTKLENRAKQSCNSAWLVALSKQQTSAARHDAQRAETLAKERERIMEGLRNDLDNTRSEFEAHKAAASSDPRCLSDGVLQLLRKRGE